MENSCELNDLDHETLMGVDADPRMTGNYFLQTNAAAPFSRGEAGTVYENVEDS